MKIELEIKGYGKHTFEKGITTRELSKQFKLDKKTFFGKLDGVRIALDKPINKSGKFKFRLDPFCNCAWEEANKISSHAIFNYLKNNKIANKIIDYQITDNYFSLEIEVNKNISSNQFSLIEGKILKEFSKNSSDYEKLSPLEPKEIKFLKLLSVSGTESKNKKTNVIFGFSTLTKDVFEQKIKDIKDRDERDHRKIGKKLKLFILDELVGKGLPIWLPNGVALKQTIKNFILEQERKYNYLQIETPVLGSLDLYKTSGHYEHYKDSMFPLMSIEKNEDFVLRPMSCPHHIVVYKSEPKSYKDLPIRFAEHVHQFRYESSGSLLGLERTRAMELTDSHIFIREDQLKEEIKEVFSLVESTLKAFNISIKYIELALGKKDDKKYHGNSKMWELAENELRDFLITNKIEFVEKEGEAAFYGPKIDIQIETALGHIITVSTIQLDFYLPEKFDLSYINENKESIRPILIHRGLIGTYERFISILLEQSKGNLPMWLAPQQAVLIPINNVIHSEYTKEIYNYLIDNNIRVAIDNSNERISYKIRNHQTNIVKSILIIGDEEVKNRTISIRYYGKSETKSIKFKDLKTVYEKR